MKSYPCKCCSCRNKKGWLQDQILVLSCAHELLSRIGHQLSLRQPISCSAAYANRRGENQTKPKPTLKIGNRRGANIVNPEMMLHLAYQVEIWLVEATRACACFRCFLERLSACDHLVSPCGRKPQISWVGNFVSALSCQSTAAGLCWAWGTGELKLAVSSILMLLPGSPWDLKICRDF